MHHPPKTFQTGIFIFIGDLYPLKCEISGQQDKGFPLGVLSEITMSAKHLVKTHWAVFPLQVRGRYRLQVGPQARVDRQELCLLGAVPLQQLLGGAPQQQGTGHRALTSLASRWCPAGLRCWLYHVLRCRRLTAPAHLPRLLCAACLPRLQRVEQVSDHPHWAAHPRSPGGPGR